MHTDNIQFMGKNSEVEYNENVEEKLIEMEKINNILNEDFLYDVEIMYDAIENFRAKNYRNDLIWIAGKKMDKIRADIFIWKADKKADKKQIIQWLIIGNI